MINAHIKDDFNNLLEFREWLNYTFDHLSDLNKKNRSHFSEQKTRNFIKYEPDWFGSETSYEELVAGVTEYKKPELIDKVLSSIDDRVTTTTRNRIKASKLTYNDVGIGAFIFDRAAMGFYRIKEFYSEQHIRKVESTEVRNSGRGFVLIQDGTPVIHRWEVKPDGKPKIRTSCKKVFAWFPPKNKEKRAVELFIGCGGHGGVSAEELLYSGISAIIIAQLLEKAQIPTRITIGLGSSGDNFERSAYLALIPVKNYNERLDVNLLALLSSDSRFFRFEGLKSYVCTYDSFNAELADGFGVGLSKQTLAKCIEQSGYATRVKLGPNRYYFGRTYTEEQAVEDIKRTIDDLASKFETQ